MKIEIGQTVWITGSGRKPCAYEVADISIRNGGYVTFETELGVFHVPMDEVHPTQKKAWIAYRDYCIKQKVKWQNEFEEAANRINSDS